VPNVGLMHGTLCLCTQTSKGLRSIQLEGLYKNKAGPHRELKFKI